MRGWVGVQLVMWHDRHEKGNREKLDRIKGRTNRRPKAWPIELPISLVGPSVAECAPPGMLFGVFSVGCTVCSLAAS